MSRNWLLVTWQDSQANLAGFLLRAARGPESHLEGMEMRNLIRYQEDGVLSKLTAGFWPKLDSARTRAKVKAYRRKDSEKMDLSSVKESLCRCL